MATAELCERVQTTLEEVREKVRAMPAVRKLTKLEYKKARKQPYTPVYTLVDEEQEVILLNSAGEQLSIPLPTFDKIHGYSGNGQLDAQIFRRVYARDIARGTASQDWGCEDQLILGELAELLRDFKAPQHI